VKSFTGGSAHYAVNRCRFTVTEKSYLILNEGQHYQIEIDQRAPLESFCLFFPPGYFQQTLRALTTDPGKLLDDPTASKRTVLFFEKIYPHDQFVSPALRELKAKHRFAESGWLEEKLCLFLEKLLTMHEETVQAAHRLPNVRRATREELFRRVYRARDYADAMFAEKVTLADLANVAALSPNHLLRTFKNVFQQTPHEFLTTRRVGEAAHLLRTTGLGVTQICLAVGFDSLGSFSALFKQRTGFSPTAYRREKSDFREALPNDSRDDRS
jgi:AraC-like DNA-binding protein